MISAQETTAPADWVESVITEICISSVTGGFHCPRFVPQYPAPPIYRTSMKLSDEVSELDTVGSKTNRLSSKTAIASRSLNSRFGDSIPDVIGQVLKFPLNGS